MEKKYKEQREIYIMHNICNVWLTNNFATACHYANIRPHIRTQVDPSYLETANIVQESEKLGFYKSTFCLMFYRPNDEQLNYKFRKKCKLMDDKSLI